jgi:hypothetical protein
METFIASGLPIKGEKPETKKPVSRWKASVMRAEYFMILLWIEKNIATDYLLARL